MRLFASLVAAAGGFRTRSEASRTLPKYSYKAFISYSHAVDGRLAPAVQLALHRFARPWYRLRAMRVFRDQASLSATPALWSSIAQALDQSEFFLLLASPEAAQSKWVDHEVARWFEQRPRSSLFVVLTGGELTWDDGAADFDWARTTALPPAARGRFEEEPRWIDLRWASKSDDVSLHNARFRDAIADLAAPLHGLPKDELVGEDVRQHRRTIRFAATAALFLAVLAVLATAGAVIAWRERSTAIRRANVARSRELASEALRNLNPRLDLSLLLSLAAYRAAPTAEARNAVATTLERSVGLTFLRGTTSERNVVSVAFSPNGKTLALGWFDGRVTLWDPARRRQLGRPLGKLSTQVTNVAFSADGWTVAASDASGALRLWDIRTMKAKSTALGRRLTRVESVAVSPHGTLIAVTVYTSSEDEEDIPETVRLELWDTSAGRRLATFGEYDAAGSLGVAFSPDGRTLLAGGSTVTLLDVARRKPLGTIREAPASAAFSPNGRTLAVGRSDGRVVFWDAARRKALPGPLRVGAGTVRSVAFDANGSVLLAGSADGKVTLWDVRHRRPIGPAANFPGGQVDDVVFAANGKPLAAGHVTDRVALLEVRAALSTPFARQRGNQFDFAFSPDGGTLALRRDDGTVTRWDVAARRQLRGRSRRGGGTAWQVALSADRKTIAVGREDGAVSLWDATSMRKETLLGHHKTGVLSLSFSHDGTTLASVDQGGTVRLWDVSDRTSLDPPLDARGSVVAFSPKAKMIAVGRGDGVLLWDAGERRRKARLPGGLVESLAFTADGRTLAVGGNDGTVALWGVPEGEQRGRLLADQGPVWSVAFGPDGRTLAAGGNGATVTLWDVAGRKPIGVPLDGEGNTTEALAFAPDGKALVAAAQTYDRGSNVVAWDGILWTDDRSALQRRICAIVARDLTAKERTDLRLSKPYGEMCRVS